MTTFFYIYETKKLQKYIEMAFFIVKRKDKKTFWGQIYGQNIMNGGNIIMARHGENIRKRADGRWEGRYRIYDTEKGKQAYHSVYGRTYDEVKKKLSMEKLSSEKLTTKKSFSQDNSRTDILNTVEQSISEQNASLQESLILTDIAQEWLKEVKEKRKHSTYVKYKFIYGAHIEKIFQNVTLSGITDAFSKDAISESLSDSMQKSIYGVVNQILKYIFQKYSIQVPAVKRPVFETRKSQVKVLAKSEQKKLISVLYTETDIYKMAVLLCLFTGLRLGELCALKWTDIDYENQLLVVGRTVQRLYAEGGATKTTLTEAAPKSVFSCREIPLTAANIELLTTFANGREYAFGGAKPLDPRTMQYQFKKILREAGLSDKNFHILRHTFATNCIEGGIDVKSLSEMLGHSDVRITLNRYVHPSMDAKREHINTLAKFYGQIYGQTG